MADNGKLMEQLEDAIQQECDRRALLEGRRYASTMEGYGDITAEVQALKEAEKLLSKEYKCLLGRIREADPQALYDKLLNCRVQARVLACYVLRMCAAVERNIVTIQMMTGGDLIDQLEELYSDKEENEDE